MTPIHDFVTGLGAMIRPHPATEAAPGGAGLVVVTPSDTWLETGDHSAGDHSAGDHSADDPGNEIRRPDAARTDTTAAVLVAPALQRSGFVPNVVATTSIITPAVPLAGLIDAVMACMEGTEEWLVRSRSMTSGDDEDLTLDLLGEYRMGDMGLALSSLVRARSAGGVTVLFQTHVTTLADQIVEHAGGLAAAQWTAGPTPATTRRES